MARSIVSTNNSTSTPLGSGETFTGITEKIIFYKSITIDIKSSHTSASNGFQIQFSTDAQNFDNIHSFTIPANTGKFFNFPIETQYFRVVYTNGTTPQTFFRLQTILHVEGMTKDITLRLSDDIGAENATQLTRSIITGKKPNGDFTNIATTSSGDLTTDRVWNLTFATDQVNVTGSSVSISDTPDVNITDRAARLLGITYGSQSQQLQQLAGTFDLITRPFGSLGQQLQQDQISKSIRVIQSAHGAIHSGELFEMTDVTLGVNVATPKRYLLVTPNTSTRIHVALLVESEPGITIEFFEDTIVTANGTELGEINHNRISTNVAELSVFEDPTVTTDGTILFTFRSGTSTGGARIGDRIQEEDEYVLKQNTNYQVKITPISNGTNITTDISWYEVV